VDTHTSGRPHLGDIAKGLIDSRVSGVDFWDTDVGRRLLERHRRGKPRAAPGQDVAGTAAAPGRLRPRWSRRGRTAG
jgi:hypothetical protein